MNSDSKRKIEFDILKGLLIIAVVMGHARARIPGLSLYWFHMPAFFLISGYFSKRLFGNRADLLKRVERLMVPFLSYSVLMYLLFWPEPIWKYAARTLYGGRLDTLFFSYPWWFVEAMVMSSVAFCVLRKVKWGGVIWTSLCYILIHIPVLWETLPRLPLGIDTALGASVFIYLGYKLRGFEFDKRQLWILILPIAFIALNNCFDWGYRLDMKSIYFRHPLLDLLVPLSFTYAMYVISLLLSKVPWLSTFLAFVGRSSLTIFFVHAAVIGPIKDEHPWLAVFAGVAVGLLVELLWRTNRYTRYLFLGQHRP